MPARETLVPIGAMKMSRDAFEKQSAFLARTSHGEHCNVP